VLTSSNDKTARLWDAETGKQLRQFAGHTAFLANVTFSPDGNTMLTSSGDATAMLWDVRSGERLRQFSGHADTVNMAVFSPDGKRILTMTWSDSYAATFTGT
jgi:WD40 repeat protein